MKEKIHPKYDFVEAVCACGNKFMTRSTVKTLKLDICAACHPFLTVTRKPKTEVKAKSKLASKAVMKKAASAKKAPKAVAPVKKAAKAEKAAK